MNLIPSCSTWTGKIGDRDYHDVFDKQGNLEDSDNDFDISTDSGDSIGSAYNQILPALEDGRFSNLEDIDWHNEGGGAHWEVLETAFDIAFKVCQGDWSKKLGQAVVDMCSNCDIKPTEIINTLKRGSEETLSRLIDAFYNNKTVISSIRDLITLLKLPQERIDIINKFLIVKRLTQ